MQQARLDILVYKYKSWLLHNHYIQYTFLKQMRQKLPRKKMVFFYSYQPQMNELIE